MAIKQDYAINRTEFNDALIKLRLNISEVSRETKIPRTYINEFRNGDRVLRPEYLGKLKDYFESKGIVFEDDTPKANEDTQQKSNAASNDPETIQRTMLAVRHLTIDHTISNTQIAAILEKIASNDAMAQDALNEKAVRQGLFDSEWSESTDENLKLVFGLFAENYVLMRHLQGRAMVVLEKPVEAENIKSVADLFANLFYAENGSLVADESNDDATGDGDKADDEVQS